MIKSLKKAGHNLIKLKCSKEGSILILPYGGRVLGLYAENDGDNFFWVNPKFYDYKQTEEFFGMTRWKNLGGDRTWVGPETEFFIKDLSDVWNTYEVPPEVDPGNYSIEKSSSMVKMRNKGRVFSYMKNKKYEFEIEKTIQPAANPLNYGKNMKNLTKQLKYAGYEQTTRLKLLTDSKYKLDIWNLIQIPIGGKIIIPVVNNIKPVIYFRFTDISKLISVYPKEIHLFLDGKTMYKIGLLPLSVTGRMDYVRKVKNDIWTLVVRNFFVNPSAEYIDVPVDNLKGPGCAIQCYNNYVEAEKFGELEYHTPAVYHNHSYVDKSQVWAFKGSKSGINKVCKLLLGNEEAVR